MSVGPCLCGDPYCGQCFPGQSREPDDGGRGDEIQTLEAELRDARDATGELVDAILGDEAPLTLQRRDAAVKRARLYFDVPEHFGPRLARAREQAGLSLRDAAERLGVTHPTILCYERQDYLPIAQPTLDLIEQHFPGLWRGMDEERKLHKLHKLHKQIQALNP